MPADLENRLIDGGISPAAAKLLSNAIENAATGKVQFGRDLNDATPVAKMRMIGPEDRKYVFTNLDSPTDPLFRERVQQRNRNYNPRDLNHPYRDSQPSTADPTLTTPSVAAGQFLQVGQTTANDVSQAKVDLALEDKGGTHARLNKGNGKVQSVPFVFETDPPGLFEGTVVEEEGRTVIKLKVVSDTLRRLINYKIGQVTSIANDVITVRLDPYNPNAAAVGWGGYGIAVLANRG